MSLLLICLAACTGEKPDTAAGPTYNADVKPILDANCTTCHNDAGAASFSLTDYASARPVASSLGSMASEQLMPPWRSAHDCNVYASDLTLPDADAATLTAWADAGAPEGDGDAGPVSVGATRLSRADLSLQVPEPYTPQADERRCFLLPYPGDDSYITGFAAVPGSAFDVRHVAVFLVPPALVTDYEALDDADPSVGYDCPGGPVAQATVDTTWLGTWTPGDLSGEFPAGTGIPIAAGSLLGLQVDYHTNAPEPDQTTALLTLDPAPAHRARIATLYDTAWVSGGMVIPAGASDLAFSYTGVVASTETLYSADVQMRSDGVSATLDEGLDGCLLDLPRWDDNWRRTYVYATPVALAAGDALTIGCHFKNDGDADVGWGDESGDEICVGLLYVAEP
jgi:hypothetical protein